MLNVPTLTEDGKMLKSEFYYAVFSIDMENHRVNRDYICVEHFHEELLHEIEYLELHRSMRMFDIKSLVTGDIQEVIPLRQEDYVSKAKHLLNDSGLKLNFLQKFILEPMDFVNLLWSVTFVFLTSLLVLIYGANLFSEGLTLGVVIILVSISLTSIFLGHVITGLRSFLGLKYIRQFLQDYGEERIIAGLIVWTALENSTLSLDEYLAKLSECEGDDDFAIFELAEVYEEKVDEKALEKMLSDMF